MRAPQNVRVLEPGAAAWSTRWVIAICEWRRWRSLGFNRWAALCILITSLNRLR